jgi:hypothetical protein
MRDQPHARPPRCTGGGNLPAAIRRYNVGRVSEVKCSTSRSRKYAGIVSVACSAFPLPRKPISADASRSSRLFIGACTQRLVDFATVPYHSRIRRRAGAPDGTERLLEARVSRALLLIAFYARSTARLRSDTSLPTRRGSCAASGTVRSSRGPSASSADGASGGRHRVHSGVRRAVDRVRSPSGRWSVVLHDQALRSVYRMRALTAWQRKPRQMTDDEHVGQPLSRTQRHKSGKKRL